MSHKKAIFFSFFAFFSSLAQASFFSKKPDLNKFFKDETQLELAKGIVANDHKKIESILKNQNPQEILNRPGYLWATPMTFALVWSDSRIIQFLIEKGGDPFQLAYKHGYPVGAMLTSTNSLKEKIEKLKAIEKAGLKLTGIRFASILNQIWPEINSADFPELQNEIVTLLFESNPEAYKSLDESGNWLFSEAIRDSFSARDIPFLLRLLKFGMNPMEGNYLSMPLSAALMRASKKDPEQRKKVMQALAEKGLAEDFLYKSFGKDPSWKTYFPTLSKFDPGLVYISIVESNSEANSNKQNPRVFLKVSIADKNIDNRDLRSQNILTDLLSSLKAKNFVWYKKIETLDGDQKYLSSLKKQFKFIDDYWLVEVELHKAFPNWPRTDSKYSIVEFSTSFFNDLNKNRVFQQIERTYISQKGICMPALESL